MFSFICAWTNGWVTNRVAGDLRRHRAHYDVTLILWCTYASTPYPIKFADGFALLYLNVWFLYANLSGLLRWHWGITSGMAFGSCDLLLISTALRQSYNWPHASDVAIKTFVNVSVGKLTTIGSNNGLSPGRRQTIIWTNVGILLIWPLTLWKTSVKCLSKFIHFHSRKCVWKSRLQNGDHFASASMC